MVSRITKIDYFILNLSYLLGASYFKKYWPVAGSFWNRKHINKKSISDLDDVIASANNYSVTHIQGLVTEFVIYIPITFMAIFCQNRQAQYSLALLPFIWFIHFYALMIHHHNRVRAKIAINYIMLDSNEIEKRKEREQEENEPIKIGQDKGQIFYVHFNYKHLSPTLNYQQAVAYRQYLYQLWSKDYCSISHNIFVNNVVNIYQQWINSI